MPEWWDDLKPGDVVIRSHDPWLFGEMLVVEIKKKTVFVPHKGSKQSGVYKDDGVKWIACLVNPNAHHRRTERFYPSVPEDELALAEDFPLTEAA